MEFHNELASLEPVRCSKYLEQFSSISLKFNDVSCCTQCHKDKLNHIANIVINKQGIKAKLGTLYML